jgi:ankyrin repeat protein
MVLEFAMGMEQKAVSNLFDIGTASELQDIVCCGLRPLSMATGHGHEAVVKLLLEKEAEMSSRNKSDRISLLVAAWSGKAGVLELLLQREADLDFKSNFGQALVWLAVFGGHEAATKLLLERRTDVEFKYEGCRTLLSYASERGHKAVIELLLEKGAYGVAKAGSSQIPLSVAS